MFLFFFFFDIDQLRNLNGKQIGFTIKFLLLFS